jgi:hypothetical protein
MRTYQKTICTLALMLGASLSANASPIVDTLGNYNSSTKTLSPSDTAHPIGTASYAESFVATSTALDDVELLLESTSGNGSFVVTLYTNSSNAPGSSLDLIANVPSSLVDTASPSLVAFTNLGATGGEVTNLSVGTEYWVEVTAMGGGSNTNVYSTTSSSIVAGTATAGTAGAPGTTDYYHGSGAGVAAPLLAICVDADGTCASLQTASVTLNEAPSSNTPEPASLAIIGLAAIGFLRRPRTRRTAA